MFGKTSHLKKPYGAFAERVSVKGSGRTSRRIVSTSNQVRNVVLSNAWQKSADEKQQGALPDE